MKIVTSFGGWLLDRAVEIDELCPGFAGHIMRASSERRHVIAAHLANGVRNGSFANDAELGQFLMVANHRDILRAAYGVVPVGFRGALSRGGSQPYRRSHYRYLYRLMSSATRPATQRLIPLLERVNPTRLKVARALATDLQMARLVMALRSVSSARDLNTLVNLLEESGADRRAMVDGLSGVGTMDDVQQFAEKWAFSICLPQHPVPPTEGYLPVETTADLRKLAIRMRNCARSYAANALEGRSAFAVISDCSGEAVVHLVRHGDRWWIEDFYGPRNSTPDRRLIDRWTAHLATHDIHFRQHHRHAHRWASLRRLAGHMDYEQDFGP